MPQRSPPHGSATSGLRIVALSCLLQQLGGETKTLNDAVLRYKEEVSPLKRGWRWELLRIEAFMKHPKWPGDRPMSELDEQDLIGWKNERRKAVKDGTVIREMGLLC